VEVPEGATGLDAV